MAKAIDLTNQQFGRLTVIERGPNIGKAVAWYCKCNCGNPNQILVRGDHLRRKEILSCGCLQKETFSNIAKKNKRDLTGQKFGKITVLSLDEEKKYHNGLVWICQCDCGNIVSIPSMHLINGHTQSCGCLGNSIGEIKIQEILEKNNISFEKEKVFSDQYFSDTQAHGRYDFYLKDQPRLIEFDGAQHYKENAIWNQYNIFDQIKLHDKEKNEYALSHNIPLVRIPYWERDNITLDMIMGDKYLVK